MKLIATLLIALSVSACTGLPKGVMPVEGFDAQRYMGTWYEIARLDHRFERGLSKVTATYALKPDGSVSVTNRGYSESKQDWSTAVGKAKFVGDTNTGHLKVSFFGPFYGSYAVFDLDQDLYQYAFIAGNNTKYLWLLARKPTITDAVKQRFLERSGDLGFDVDSLIWIEQ